MLNLLKNLSLLVIGAGCALLLPVLPIAYIKTQEVRVLTVSIHVEGSAEGLFYGPITNPFARVLLESAYVEQMNADNKKRKLPPVRYVIGNKADIRIIINRQSVRIEDLSLDPLRPAAYDMRGSGVRSDTNF